jgi:hypothetical protein
MRGTPPTVPSEVMAPDIKMPEKIRTFDEAAVLVGNEKTLAGQEKLWREVKKLKPKCLQQVSKPFLWWGGGLSTALRTTNPFVPAQNLFPQAIDRMVVRTGAGLHSIANCPGRYSLQVADFSHAGDAAERLAERLSKDPEFRRLGQPIYVYHDRKTTKVFVGSFDDPHDPAADALRSQLAQDATALATKDKKGRAARDAMVVPAIALTDLSELKAMLKN